MVAINMVYLDGPLSLGIHGMLLGLEPHGILKPSPLGKLTCKDRLSSMNNCVIQLVSTVQQSQVCLAARKLGW